MDANLARKTLSAFRPTLPPARPRDYFMLSLIGFRDVSGAGGIAVHTVLLRSLWDGIGRRLTHPELREQYLLLQSLDGVGI
eukprot:9884979-Alexandrium_andersonii.AAC.1